MDGRPDKVIGVGLACLDQVILWKDAGQSVAEGKILASEMHGGGMVATALVAVSRLAGRAEYWGVVGGDWMGRHILDGLSAEGVDISQVRVLADQEGPMLVVCVDGPTGERSLHSVKRVDDPVEPVGELDRLAQAGCLLVDGMRLNSAVRSARRARELSVPVVMDLGWLRQALEPLLEQVDYVIANEAVAQQLGEGDVRRACETLRAKGPAVAVVTLGSRGLAACDGQRFIELPAYTVPVVDTTGAGDTFHGAFCRGLVMGLDLETNLRFSSAAAALKCRRLGGRAGIPQMEEVRKFLRQHGVELPKER